MSLTSVGAAIGAVVATAVGGTPLAVTAAALSHRAAVRLPRAAAGGTVARAA